MNNDIVTIESIKHDRSPHRKWLENKLLHRDDAVLIGMNYRTIVMNKGGTQWCTLDPAIFYFHKDYWFNTIIIFRKSDYYYYCNISSPFTTSGNKITYIDYDIDIIVEDDFSYKIVDKNEFEERSKQLCYPIDVINEVERAIKQIEQLISSRSGPFHPNFVHEWYDKLRPYIRDRI